MNSKHTGWVKIALFLILFGLSSARADQPLTPTGKLKTSQDTSLEQALRASFGFRLTPGVACTGTFISNTGHFVTALHCISACLGKIEALHHERALDKVLIAPDSKKGGKLKVLFPQKVTVDEERLKANLICSGVIDNKNLNMRVLMTGGPGWLAPRNVLAMFSKWYPGEYKQLIDEGYEHSGDFAVLQIVDTEPTHCLSIIESTPSIGQRLQAVSYSCLERKKLRTTGQTPLYTSGRRTAGFKDSAYFKKLGPDKIEFDVESIERKETFFSTLDIEKCGSGTSLLDESSNIVGIATRVYKHSTDYEYGSLEAIHASHIINTLKRKRPGDFREITMCSQPTRGAPESRKIATTP